MTSGWPLAAALLLTVALVLPAVAQTSTARSAGPAPQAADEIAGVRLQGNQITPDDELVRLSGVVIGAPFTATTIAEVTDRLRRTGLFQDVQVLKRLASIADPSQVLIVIIVNEGPVSIEVPDEGPARVVRRRRLTNLLVMPILHIEDGYGVTFGARLAYAGLMGKRSRVSFPLTWGGFKQAGVEFDRLFVAGPLSRVEGGASIERRRNPAFDINDDRRRLWGGVGRVLGPVRFGGGGAWQRVSFAGETDVLRSVTAEVGLDSRLDPALPRNAVHAQAAVERISFGSGAPPVTRTTLDGRGYLGMFGQAVLAVRVRREHASRPQPLYLKSLLGGDGNLRGFEPGAFVGDVLVAGSMEVRIPLSDALSAGKVGVNVFVDAGTAYDKGQVFRDQTLHVGGGASVWLAATVFRVGLTVAHGRGAGTRVTIGAGLTR